MGSFSEDIFYKNGTELVEFYRNNPCIAAKELLNVDLAPIQRLIFKDMWFKNYVITVASRGLGKSVGVDSKVLIGNKGFVYLNEVLPVIPSCLKDGEEKVIDFNISIFTSDGLRYTKRLSLEHNIRGKRLVTNTGFEHTCSVHHPLLTMDTEGNFTYKQIRELCIGDYICIQRCQNVFGKNSIDIKEAYNIGVDTAVNNKDVPLTIRMSDKSTQQSFLNGVFFIAGRSDLRNNSQYLYSVNKKFLQEIQFMLLNLGVIAKLIFIHNDNRLYYIHEPDAVTYDYSYEPDTIPYVKKLLYEIRKDYRLLNRRYRYDNILPSLAKECRLYSGITYNSLNNFMKDVNLLDKKGLSLSDVSKNKLDILRTIIKNNYYFDIVNDISDWVGDCYDFEMDMDTKPNYLANGFINHNTFLLGTLAALSALLYPGYRIGLIGPVKSLPFMMVTSCRKFSNSVNPQRKVGGNTERS